MSDDPYRRFKTLTYTGFRDLATDTSLSRYEKIGFPNSYREGKEAAIFADILHKLPQLQGSGRVVLDIGPGCTDIPVSMSELCAARSHTLLFVDAPEMLALLPDSSHIQKHPGRFPDDCDSLLTEYKGKVNVILVYSVFHYIFAEGNVFAFVDACMDLLAPEGELLIGDIPNISKRRRFFSSEAGIRCHREFTGSPDALPEVVFNRVEAGEIDDAVLTGIMLRARAAGCDAYILPQPPMLPMANRREDLLIRRP